MPLGFLILFASNIFPYLFTGPDKTVDWSLNTACQQEWWQHLLFITTLYQDSKLKCVGWDWYLANDMQFFVLTPFILML